MRGVYLPAHDNILYGAAVSSTAGSIDATSDANYLCDGRGRPAMWTNGTAGASAVGVSGRVDLVVIHAHNFDPALSITISGGGGLSGSDTAPPARRNLIPTSIGIIPTVPLSTTTVQFGVAGNSVPVRVGEMLAGPLSIVAHGFPLASTQWGYVDGGSIRRQSRFGTVPDLDLEQCKRWLRTTTYLTQAECDDVMAWWEGTRNGTKPSVILPFGENLLDDAWVVGFSARPSFGAWQQYRTATLEFEEWPRTRW